MTDNTARAQIGLAFFYAIAFVVVLCLLILRPPQVDEFGKAVLQTLLGGLLVLCTQQSGYFFARQRPDTPSPGSAVTSPPASTIEPRQGGFARPLLLAMMLAIAIPTTLVLQGCQSLGLQQPANLTQRIDHAYGNVTAVVNTAIAGRERGQLSKDEGEFVSALAKDARVVLRAADTLNGVGDTRGAEGRLLLALGILAQLDNYLNSKAVRIGAAP